MSTCARIFRLLNLNNQCRAVLKSQECHIHRWVWPTLRELKVRQQREVPKLPNPRNTYLEWNRDAELFAFNKRLSENFEPDLLRRAFIHRSFIIQEEMKQRAVGIDNPDIKQTDNREYIDEGDAFINEYIDAYLSVALPKLPMEGVVSIRKYLTERALLANVASHIGCKDLILSDEYPITDETLEKTFKALVAALIHSAGEERAAHFVRDFVITLLKGLDINDLWPIEDPVKMLDTLLKKSGMKEIEYRLISQSAKNSILSCFHVGVYTDKKMFSRGFGETIPIAKDIAAREGLKAFFGTQENMPPINFKIDGIPKDKAQYIEASQSS